MPAAEQADTVMGYPQRPEIILRPQPSDSGLDPLNFSKWRKEIMFLIFFVGSICTGVIGPILVPAFGTVAQDLGVTVPRVAQLNGIRKSSPSS